jgi:aminoglycoside phosphotransferase
VTASVPHAPAAIRDEILPVAPELLGAAGLELAAEVAAEGGGRVTAVEARQALYSPGRGISVNFHAEVTWADAEPTELVVAAIADRDALPPEAPVRRWGGGEVAAWRFPADPVLTGLPQVVDQNLLAELLGYLHLEPRRVKVTPLVYRPTRRAVLRLSLRGDRMHFDRQAGRVELRAAERHVFLKVVRPSQVAAIAKVHEDLYSHLPIPRCFGVWDDLGLLALEGMPGLTLRDYIRLREGAPPSAEELLELLDALSVAAPPPEARVRSMRRRVKSHERLLRVILPDHEQRIRALSRRLRDLLPSERPAVVHADFYDSQLLVDDWGRVTGLLDLDGVGWGDPADDLASMLGRIWTSGQTAGRGRDRFARYAGELLDGFSRHVDRRDLCLRVAGIVFGRATGPFRMQADGWREKALERIEMCELCMEHALRGELPA